VKTVFVVRVVTKDMVTDIIEIAAIIYLSVKKSVSFIKKLFGKRRS